MTSEPGGDHAEPMSRAEKLEVIGQTREGKCKMRTPCGKVLAAVAVSLYGLLLGATDMEHKSKTILTCPTARAGIAEITCDSPGEWKFSAEATVDSGRDVVTVHIAMPEEIPPPQFGVYFRGSGAGVRNVWTSDASVNGDGCHLRPKLWWGRVAKYRSELASNMPLAVGFNSKEVAPVAVAASEAMRPVEFGLYADDETCDIICRCEFFTCPSSPMKEYSVSVMVDRRGGAFADTVREATDWIVRANGFRVAHVPDAAFEPLYSTWYAYLQDVNAEPLEAEARAAAALGMKTMILDDGWQKVDSATFYSAVGDWMPVKSRFPDMKAHVDAVHKAGLKYMLWLSVPTVGDESKAFSRFNGKYLKVHGDKSPGRNAVLDPRFPEVREYLISTYERAVGEWGFDGVKLDFIDTFKIDGKDPAVAENYAGRDYRELPLAVDRLMKDILFRLQKINPDVLVEFRQSYIGPAILQYGNMIRASDCPADPAANRRRVCNLRLTSQTVAVHSDMLVWSKDETPEGAVVPILNALYSTIQYSMILDKIEPAHKRVIKHWLDFSRQHREALLKGRFAPHHAECGYTWVEGESADERVVTSYLDDAVIQSGAADKPVVLVNATESPGLLVEFAAKPSSVACFNVFGEHCGMAEPSAGLLRLSVPASGYAVVKW